MSIYPQPGSSGSQTLCAVISVGEQHSEREATGWYYFFLLTISDPWASG